MTDRPITTLFMMMSLDGKISTGPTDDFDVDRDFPLLEGVREGLHQYYEIEQTTDLWSFNTGRVQGKMGVNELPFPARTPVSFVLLDNSHLTEHGVRYFCARSKTFVLITSNPDHPAFQVSEPNLYILFQERPSLPDAFVRLKSEYGCERMTLQSGATVNSLLLKEHLIDYVDIVVAPVLIGGTDTPSLIGGSSLVSREELRRLGILKLIDCTVLEDSWIRLRYEIKKRKGDK